MVFQNPYSAVNRRKTVLDIITEPLAVHGIGTRAERQQRGLELLRLVGLSEAFAARYPHEVSGGQLQRIGIARALALKPEFIVADEPTASLDVSVRAQVINLLADLQAQLGLTLLFISHDLSIVSYLSDRIAVMYLGKIVELGPKSRVESAPLHPYTRALLAAIPRPDPAPAAGEERTPRGDPKRHHPAAGVPLSRALPLGDAPLCHPVPAAGRENARPSGGLPRPRAAPGGRAADARPRRLDRPLTQQW
ncbi:MAG: hypothetical protein KatS3mg061_2994 [Dehalococcoidia bacterium]|nr:MAG: hypothetical protein KatS3mg061_2994 [Dehalococcoidia bacterium]